MNFFICQGVNNRYLYIVFVYFIAKLYTFYKGYTTANAFANSRNL